ncbi:MAG TPA: haloacid dehalogenase [bacterium]|nr:haloacid dehalogenase [bacterium]HPO51684.1 haloacid dehalogenase [bacterium]HXK44547.1 haloacid dehalogenase [bacterium]
MLENLEKDIRDFFETEDKIREQTLKLSRDVTRCSARAIKKLHQGDFEESQKLLEQAMSSLVNAKKILAGFPEILYAGFVHNAEKELIEGLVFYRIVKENSLFVPDFDVFDRISYLHGIAEAMGELRRHILDQIRQDNTKNMEQFLSLMDEVYYFSSSFDYPDVITRGLRRTVDVLRAIVEKTRADITLVLQQKKFEKKLENR